MNKSIGQPIVVVILIGAPSRKLENSDRIPSGSSLWIVVEGCLAEAEVAEGIEGRKEPRSSLNLSFSIDRSVSADVPTLARRMARLRSCSRITEDDECGFDKMSLSIRRRSTSRMSDTVYSPFLVRK